MAGNLTLWGAGQFLGAQFGKLYPVPDQYYLALIRNTAPTAFVSGQELDEPTGGYSRAIIPNDNMTWGTTGQLQVIVTIADVSFEPAVEAWGVCRYWALCNAPNGGFVYAIGNLDPSLDVAEDDLVRLEDGDLSITLGPFYQ